MSNYKEYKETEFIGLVKNVMRMSDCSFPEVAGQLIFAGRGPGKYKDSNVAKDIPTPNGRLIKQVRHV